MKALFYKRALVLVGKLIEAGRANEIPEVLRKLAEKMDVVGKEFELLARQAEYVGSRAVAAQARIELADAFSELPADMEELIRSAMRRQMTDEDVEDRIKKALSGSRHRTNVLIRTASLAISQENVNQEAVSAFAGDENKVLMRYSGPSGANSRVFCRTQLGQVRTLAEWRRLLNQFGQSTATWCGGYNCTHRLVVVQ